MYPNVCFSAMFDVKLALLMLAGTTALSIAFLKELLKNHAIFKVLFSINTYLRNNYLKQILFSRGAKTLLLFEENDGQDLHPNVINYYFYMHIFLL